MLATLTVVRIVLAFLCVLSVGCNTVAKCSESTPCANGGRCFEGVCFASVAATPQSAGAGLDLSKTGVLSVTPGRGVEAGMGVSAKLGRGLGFDERDAVAVKAGAGLSFDGQGAVQVALGDNLIIGPGGVLSAVFDAGLAVGVAPDDPRLSNARPAAGDAGGDLSGAFPSPTVRGLQGVPVRAVAPNEGKVLTFVDGGWQPGDPFISSDELWPVGPNGVFRDLAAAFRALELRRIAPRGSVTLMLEGVTFPSATELSFAHLDGQRVFIRGESDGGTLLSFSAPTTGLHLRDTTLGGLRDVVLRGAAGNQNGGIALENSQLLSINNVRVAGFLFGVVAQTSRVWATDLTVNNCVAGGIGVYAYFGSHVELTAPFIRDCEQALYVSTGSGLSTTNAVLRHLGAGSGAGVTATVNSWLSATNPSIVDFHVGVLATTSSSIAMSGPRLSNTNPMTQPNSIGFYAVSSTIQVAAFDLPDGGTDVPQCLGVASCVLAADHGYILVPSSLVAPTNSITPAPNGAANFPYVRQQ